MEKQKKTGVLKPALICILAMTLICGIIYPALMSGIGYIFFPQQASGSFVAVEKDGKEVVIGSMLMGQDFTKPEYLIGRPNGGAPTNLSALSDEQQDVVAQRVAWWHEFDPNTIGQDIPEDLVTVGGSGYDPEISYASAQLQIKRIAQARNMSEEEVQAIIDHCTKKPTLGILGETRVNVLEVNIQLDGLKVV